MSWGVEIWDQHDNVALHTQNGYEFLEKFGHFVKECATIELEYATKLRKLVKTYRPKKKEEEDYRYSSCRAFLQMMDEFNDKAGQHEIVAENLQQRVCKEVALLLKELKEERKKHLVEGRELLSNLGNSLGQLDKSKRAYDKAFKEAEKAQENYSKADADLTLSRADLEKAKQNLSLKNQLCDDGKTEYANQLQITNKLQQQHYSDLMPKVFQQLQDMDERRITCVQNFIKQTADIQREVFPILNKCLDGVVRSAELINPKDDSLLVIERYKSGFEPPDDIPFEDLSNRRNGEAGNVTLHSVPSFRSETLRGTLSTGKLKKRGGIFGIFTTSKEDYGDLPPNQRRKKLQQKIDQINSTIQQELSTKDGLIKMKEAYEQNPAMGDPLSVEGQLVENKVKLEKLHAELQKYQHYLSDAEGKPGTPNSQKKTRNSISEESLSRSASDSSVSNPVNANHKPHNDLNVPSSKEGASNSPESGIGTSHTSIPDADADVDGEFEHVNSEFDNEPLPVLGTARALYAFDAHSEGSMAMIEGEEFEIVEFDQGDGWTRVRRNNLEEGFVPTSYIECFASNSC